MKQKKQEREVRRIRHQPAWITLNGVATGECEIMGISKTGAKIVPDGRTVIPPRFELAFGDQKRQPCEVVWRRGRMLGVRFIRLSQPKNGGPEGNPGAPLTI